MGSVLEEQFAEFVWRMEWLQEAEQKLALTRANRLYLEGLRPPENDHVTYHRDQAEANAAQAAQQGAPAEPDSSVGWMTRNLWGCSWYATAMMIDNTLDVGRNWRKTSGKRSILICATGIYAATQDGGYGCWPPACDVVLSLLCIPFGFHGKASKMLGRRARLGLWWNSSSRCAMISWYGVVMIWTFNHEFQVWGPLFEVSKAPLLCSGLSL